MITDQYGNPIPSDLTLLENEGIFNPKEVEAIDKLDWYCFEGNQSRHIFVSQEQLEKILDGGIDNYPPEEFGSDKIVKIDAVLHRYNYRDGFYWA